MFISLLLISACGALVLAREPHLEHKSIFGARSDVIELQTPLELRRQLDDGQVAIHMTLLYSAWCPHCQAFAPVWSQLGSELRCGQNERLIRISAFECLSQHTSRTTSSSEWLAYAKIAFPEQTQDSVIAPAEVCAILADGSYPSILVSRKKSSHVIGLPFEPFSPPKGVVPSETEVYHLPVDSRSTSLRTLLRILEEPKLAESCQDGGSRHDNEEQSLLSRLDDASKAGDGALIEGSGARWDELATDMNPDLRLHDSIIGIYHILNDWIFAERSELTQTELTALRNFLLALATSLPDEGSKLASFALLRFVADHANKMNVTSWRNRLQQFELMNLPMTELASEPQSRAKTCQSSSCPVWLLFHTLAELRLKAMTWLSTSGVTPILLPLYSNTSNPDISSLSSSQIRSTLHIKASDFAITLDQLVTSFFRCETCQAHFHEAFEACAADRCALTQEEMEARSDPGETADTRRGQSNLQTSRGLAMWLWRFHNMVTVRTATDETLANLSSAARKDGDEVPRFRQFAEQDVRFPGIGSCPSCRNESRDPLILSPVFLRNCLLSEDQRGVAWDYVDDWEMVAIATYIHQFYTRPQWVPSLKSMSWHESLAIFQTTGDTGT